MDMKTIYLQVNIVYEDFEPTIENVVLHNEVPSTPYRPIHPNKNQKMEIQKDRYWEKKLEERVIRLFLGRKR